MNELRNSKSDDQLEELLLLTEQMQEELDQKDRTIRELKVQLDESLTLNERLNSENRAGNIQALKNDLRKTKELLQSEKEKTLTAKDMIEEVPFYDDEIVLCINPSYSKDEIKIKEVKRIPLIMRDSDSGTYKMVKRFLGKSGIDMSDLDILIRSNCTEIIKSSILKSCCASFVSKSCIQNELKSGQMKIIKISDLDNFDDLRFSYHLIKRKQYKLNTYEQSFYDFLLKNQ